MANINLMKFLWFTDYFLKNLNMFISKTIETKKCWLNKIAVPTEN